MDYKAEYERWLKLATDSEINSELKGMDDVAVEDAFYRNLAFGTGGLRGTIGAGTNRMNIYVVAKASQGLSDYLLKTVEGQPSVVVGYDSRIKSDLFAKVAASVFAANGLKQIIRKALACLGNNIDIHTVCAGADRAAESACTECKVPVEGILHRNIVHTFQFFQQPCISNFLKPALIFCFVIHMFNSVSDISEDNISYPAVFIFIDLSRPVEMIHLIDNAFKILKFIDLYGYRKVSVL